jgi:hypothetical protein
MASPAHRAAILSVDTDRLGLGVIDQYEQGRPAFYVTELFARQPFEITPAQALNDGAARIAAVRAERSLSPLIPDTRLSEAATLAAQRFIAEPTLAQEALLNAALKSARAPRGARAMTAQLFIGMLPSSLELTDVLLDPNARWVGIGVAHGDRPPFGPAALAVVVLVAQ